MGSYISGNNNIKYNGECDKIQTKCDVYTLNCKDYVNMISTKEENESRSQMKDGDLIIMKEDNLKPSDHLNYDGCPIRIYIDGEFKKIEKIDSYGMPVLTGNLVPKRFPINYWKDADVSFAFEIIFDINIINEIMSNFKMINHQEIRAISSYQDSNGNKNMIGFPKTSHSESDYLEYSKKRLTGAPQLLYKEIDGEELLVMY